MKTNRRELLLSMGAAGFLFSSGCSSARRPVPRLLPSRAQLPDPFTTPLFIPEVLKPVERNNDADVYEMIQRPGEAEILPALKTRIWGYQGTFPGPTIEARRGRQTILRVRNELDVPTVTHLHGGRTAPESDGYPTDLLLPVTGSAAIPHMHDPRAQLAQGCRDYIYTNQQPAAMLWYHDHRMDFTAPQVWRGLAGCYIIRDSLETALPLPKASKEVPLMICDRSFAEDGSFLYPAQDAASGDSPGMAPAYMGGVLGDVILVNGVPWPQLDVSNTRYRLRILNASNARWYELALDPPPPAAAFIQVGSDGGVLAAPLQHDTLRIAPAERFDTVVDFSHFPIDSKIVLRNRLGSGTTRNVMCFHVTGAEKDHSWIPPKLAEVQPLNPASAATVRSFDFRIGDDNGQRCWLINGKPFDPARMDARPRLGTTEIWRITTDMHHPVHLHLSHFQVLSHSGRPTAYDSGWKDTVDLGAGEVTNLIVPFDSYRGRYVFHCHNLEHEDMAMMGNFEVV
jgi:spore coat protein A, manganese oxidase